MPIDVRQLRCAVLVQMWASPGVDVGQSLVCRCGWRACVGSSDGCGTITIAGDGTMVGVRVGQSVGNADGESVGANDGENERRSSVSFDGTAVGVCKRKYALARNTARAADAGVHGTPRLRRVWGVQVLASVQMRALASAQACVRARVLSDGACIALWAVRAMSTGLWA